MRCHATKMTDAIVKVAPGRVWPLCTDGGFPVLKLGNTYGVNSVEPV